MRASAVIIYKISKSLKLLGSLTIIVASVFPTKSISAQSLITPDKTLGSESSTVIAVPNLPSELIGGGVQQGANLFHSFREFNIKEGWGAYFENPAGIENIISRVTGTNPSQILGRLGVSGNANFFLINPNGIIFGPNSSLSINGSFIASTASSILFADGTQFSATHPDATPLLTIAVPIGLQFGETKGQILVQASSLKIPPSSSPSPTSTLKSTIGQEAGRIVDEILLRPIGLGVMPGKTLALLGGDVVLQRGNLTAFEGHIEIGSVASGIVTLIPTKTGWNFGYEDVQNSKNIQLSQQAVLNVSGNGAGAIHLHGREVTLTNESAVLSVNFGDKNSGDISLDSEKLTVADGSIVATATLGLGNGGNLKIKSDNVRFQNALAATVSLGENGGNAGDLTIIATNLLDLQGKFRQNQLPSGLITSSDFEAGDSGNITITTNTLRVQDGAFVSVATAGTGRGGDLKVNASESVELIGTTPTDTSIFFRDFFEENVQTVVGLYADTARNATAGNIEINTAKLVVLNGAAISASSFGSGQGGNLIINALESVELRGTSPDKTFNSGLFSGTQNNGISGNVSVNTRNFIAQEGQILARSRFGSGGNIALNVQELLLLRLNSQISTTAGIAGVGGNGGNITINARFIVAIPNESNDITANAFQGSGGNIQINTQGIFGITSEQRQTSFSDITATSELGVQGTVEINNPNISPSQERLVEPSFVDGAEQIEQSFCRVSGGSAFTVTGRSGLPPSPEQLLGSQNDVWEDLSVTLDSEQSLIRTVPEATTRRPQIASNKPTKIVEAQGWILAPNGKVMLVSEPHKATPNSSRFPSPNC